MRLGWLGVAAVLLAGCGGGTERYAGRMVPEAPSALCREGRAMLQVRSGQAVFVPDERALVLEGEVGADGAVRAGRETAGADRRPFAQVFEGRIEGDRATGVYGTPRCRHRVEMSRG